MLDKLKLRQPLSGIAKSLKKARAIADSIGYPILIRPSYVLGGRAMEIVHDAAHLDRYFARLVVDLGRPSELAVSDKRPLLIDRYLSDAIEVDVDCIADGKHTYVAGIMQHIEEAGVHSGDSACALPPHSLSAETIAELTRQTEALALALDVRGLMNVQYAIKDGDIYVLEVNPRASRTVPFVAKVIGLPVAKIAARIMAGESLASLALAPPQFTHVGVKEAVFPFARFPGVDTVLGPEMRSTGEVMGIDSSFEIAFAKSQIGGGARLPRAGTVFVSVRDVDKSRILEAVKLLAAAWLQGDRHLGHPTLSRRAWRARAEGEQSAGGTAAHRRRHQERGSAARFQHDRGGPGARRFGVACAAPPSCIKFLTTPLFPEP